MKRFLVGIVLAIACAAPAWAQDSNRQTIGFSDASRPGTVVVRATGSITIKAYDGRNVTVESTGLPAPNLQWQAPFGVPQRSPANPVDTRDLRRIDSSASSVGLSEANNVVTIQTGAWGGQADLQIQVPVRTNLKVDAAHGRAVIEGVDGEIEVNGNGDVVLTDVSGSVVAHSATGNVTVSIRRATAQKPMSFVTSAGSVDVTLPADVKANIKARTMVGEIYTGFQASELSVQPLTGNAPAPDKGVFLSPFHYGADRSAGGALNGGGPDFEFRTLHGNIYIRKRK